MADPFTIAFGIIASVGTVIMIIKEVDGLIQARRARKSSQHGTAQIGSSAPDRACDAEELSQLVNQLMSFLGRGFGEKIDDGIKKEIDAILPQLKSLVSDLDSLKHDVASNAGKEDDVVAEGIDNRSRKLLARVICMKTKISESLRRFIKRVGVETAISCPAVPLMASERPRSFCYGALLCQSGKFDAKAISGSASGEWGFNCVYCNLEVGNYDAMRLSSSFAAMESSNLLAACHVMACSSWDNCRAYYKCLACYWNHKDVDFPSALGLEKHMSEHPGYRFVPNEQELIQATDRRIRDVLDDPAIVSASASSEAGDGDMKSTEPPEGDSGVLPSVVTQLPKAGREAQRFVTSTFTKNRPASWREMASDDESSNIGVSPVDVPDEGPQRPTELPDRPPARPSSDTSRPQVRHELSDEMRLYLLPRVPAPDEINRPFLSQPIEVPAHVPERQMEHAPQNRFELPVPPYQDRARPTAQAPPPVPGTAPPPIPPPYGYGPSSPGPANSYPQSQRPPSQLESQGRDSESTPLVPQQRQQNRSWQNLDRFRRG